MTDFAVVPIEPFEGCAAPVYEDMECVNKPVVDVTKARAIAAVIQDGFGAPIFLVQYLLPLSDPFSSGPRTVQLGYARFMSKAS